MSRIAGEDDDGQHRTGDEDSATDGDRQRQIRDGQQPAERRTESQPEQAEHAGRRIHSAAEGVGHESLAE